MKMLIRVNAMSIEPSRAEKTGRMRVGTHASPLVDYQFSPAFTCGERPAKGHCRVHPKPTSTSYDVARVPLFPIAPFVLENPFDPYDS